MRLVAVDPGDKHNGVAFGLISDGDLYVGRVFTTDRLSLYGELYHEASKLDLVIVEEYRLYPELARAQGYSDFPTPQVIGGIMLMSEWLTLFPVHMAKAEVKKRARRIGERAEMPGKIRTVNKVRGWDFEGKTQHERDAIAHLVWWTFRNTASPLFERDLKRESRVFING